MTIPHDEDRTNSGVRVNIPPSNHTIESSAHTLSTLRCLYVTNVCQVAIHYSNGDSFENNILVDGADAGTGRGDTITQTVKLPQGKTCENCIMQVPSSEF